MFRRGNSPQSDRIAPAQVAAKLVAVVVPSLLVCVVGASTVIILALPDQWTRLVPGAIVLSLMMVVWRLIRQGRVPLAAHVLFGTVNLAVLAGMTLNGGVRAPIYAVSLVIIAMAGWLYGRRGAIATSISWACVGGVFLLLQGIGVLPRYIPLEPWIYWWLITLLAVLMVSSTAVPSAMLHQALASSEEARRIEQQLAATISAREQALMKSELTFRTLFEGANDAILVLENDRFVDCNRKTLQMFRCEKADILARSPVQLSPERQPNGDLSADVVLRKIASALAGTPQHFEWRHIRSDHTLFDAEVSLNRIELGQDMVLQAVVRDVTRRKRAEEERARLAAILECTGDLVSIATPDRRLTYMNGAGRTILGWDEYEFSRHAISDVHPHWAIGIIIHEGIPTAIKKGLWKGETAILNKEGQELPVSQMIMAHRSRNGELQYLSTIMRDISEQKRYQEYLQRFNTELEQQVAERTALAERRAQQLRALAYQLAHSEQRERERIGHLLHDNLQQTLAAAKFQLGALRSSIGDKSALDSVGVVDDYLNQSIELLRTLTSELYLAVLQEVGLGPALEWLARQMKIKHGLDVNTLITAQVEQDEQRTVVFLFEAARELLLNVLQHSGASCADVTLDRLEGGQVQLTVSDEGIGFDQAKLSESRYPDTGLGLVNIRERLEYIGGGLNIETAPGCGTRVTLTITIPERPDVPDEQERDIMEAVQPEQVHDKTWVLLVDDHAIVRQGIKDVLAQEADIAVIAEASNGKQAIELAHQFRPDVIIMDINLPMMNGIEATRRISEQLPDIQIIGLSMFSQADQAAAMFEAGAVDYLTKDGPLEDLLAAIRRCAGRLAAHAAPGEE